MEIESFDMLEILEREFQNDPIYKMCLINGLKNDLFSNNILSLHPETSYSTVETGRIIERPDSTIRNHFRSDLISYIEPEKFGKYYRMDYRSVFKLHMIFLLMEKCGKGTVDILVELGTEPSITVTNGKRINRNLSNEEFPIISETALLSLEDRLKSMEETNTKNNQIMLLLENLNSKRLEVLNLKNEIFELNNRIDRHKSGVEKITYEIRIKYLEEKQTNILSNSLKNSLQKPSFFSTLFGSKTKTVNIDEISRDISSRLSEKYDKEVKERTSEDSQKIQLLQEELTQKMKLLEEKQDELKKIESFSKYALESQDIDVKMEPTNKNPLLIK